METPAQSVQRNEFEIKAEEQIEKLVGHSKKPECPTFLERVISLSVRT